MILIGLGSDIIDIRRIEKLMKAQGTRFESRHFTDTERKKAKSRAKAGAKMVASAYAKRFAAKEACAKALGCGIGKDAGFKDMEIANLKSGAPTLALSGAAQKRLTKLTPRGKKARVLLTLADEYPYALAQVIIVAD